MENPPHNSFDLVLASASLRRHELVKSLGLSFKVFVSDIDETPFVGETPSNYVERLAREKAITAQTRLIDSEWVGLPVLAADTIVSIDNTLLQKPNDKEEAKAMLRQLSGRTHHVYSGIAVSHGANIMSVVQSNRVSFMPLSQDFIDWYVSTGEPMDKAGSYAIQGKGGVMIEYIEGSFTGIMGLPLHETYELLKKVGIELK